MRKNRVIITEAGQKAAKECRESMDRLEMTMLQGFSEEELEILSGFVRRMEANLSDIQKEDSRP